MIYQDGNFWDLYPVYKIKKPFKYIWDKYKGTTKSSNMAWYVFLFSEPSSEFFVFPEEERKIELEQAFGEVHNLPEVQQALEEYDDYMCSADAKAFKQWTKKLTERAKFLDQLEYIDLETATKIDTLLVSSLKIWEAYKKIKDQYTLTSLEGNIMGGGEETFIEK